MEKMIYMRKNGDTSDAPKPKNEAMTEYERDQMMPDDVARMITETWEFAEAA